MEEKKCSVCGSAIPEGNTFCPNCGSPVEGSESAGAAAGSISPEPTATVSTPEQQETVSAPEQQETTVLSGNPYNVSNHTAQTVNPDAGSAYQQPVDAGVSGTYQQPVNAGVGGAYQQPVDAGVSGTYQQSNAGVNYSGTYAASSTYTQPAPENTSKGLGIAGLILAIIGLLTSCCFGGFIFGVIGIILSIVAIAKKRGKGLGIAGIIIGAIALIISCFGIAFFDSWMNTLEDYIGDDYTDDDYTYDVPEEPDNWDWDDSDTTGDADNTDTSAPVSSNVSGTNQMLVDGTLYTMPATLSELGLTISSVDSDTLDDITTNGLTAGDYEFVVLDSVNGYSFWGYVENTGSDTIYSQEELSLTGINVDNYSDVCTATSAEVYNGITLNMTRSEVEAILGTSDYTDDSGQECYESLGSGVEVRDVLRIEYDEYDYVIALDVTIYMN